MQLEGSPRKRWKQLEGACMHAVAVHYVFEFATHPDPLLPRPPKHTLAPHKHLHNHQTHCLLSCNFYIPFHHFIHLIGWRWQWKGPHSLTGTLKVQFNSPDDGWPPSQGTHATMRATGAVDKDTLLGVHAPLVPLPTYVCRQAARGGDRPTDCTAHARSGCGRGVGQWHGRRRASQAVKESCIKPGCKLHWRWSLAQPKHASAAVLSHP